MIYKLQICKIKKVQLQSAEFSFIFPQELITRILQLESHNQQLKNVLKKEMNITDDGNSTSNNNQRKFDFTK